MGTRLVSVPLFWKLTADATFVRQRASPFCRSSFSVLHDYLTKNKSLELSLIVFNRWFYLSRTRSFPVLFTSQSNPILTFYQAAAIKKRQLRVHPRKCHQNIQVCHIQRYVLSFNWIENADFASTTSIYFIVLCYTDYLQVDINQSYLQANIRICDILPFFPPLPTLCTYLETLCSLWEKATW